MDVKRRKSSKEEGDAFSKLTEDLLCHILSFLSTEEAVVTSVLSKRWRDLFKSKPSFDLDLDVSVFVLGGKPEECERTSFMEYVNRVLDGPSNSPITKFSLRCHRGLRCHKGLIDDVLVEDLILKALRRGATDVTLTLLFPSRGYSHSLPPSILSYAQNMIKLRLGFWELVSFCKTLSRGEFIFTNLKTLHLDSINPDYRYNYPGHDTRAAAFALLLSRCPVLEELIVNCIKWQRWSSSSVSSPTLKRLTIDPEQYLSLVYSSMLRPHPGRRERFGCGKPMVMSTYWDWGAESPRHVSFDTPNLLYLNYSDFVACDYPLVKLDSLVEARLDVGSTKAQMRVRDSDDMSEVRWDATNLIMGVHNVQTLHLTSDTLEVIADFCKAVPVFNNLKHLSIEGDAERGWQALPLLLNNCPILQTLVFHGLHHGVTDGCGDACNCISSSSSSSSSSSCLSSCPVKTLKILEFGATCGEMSLVEHFLKKLPQLEQATIVIDLESSLEEDLDLSQVSEALEMAPRASPNCKLNVVNY